MYGYIYIYLHFVHKNTDYAYQYPIAIKQVDRTYAKFRSILFPRKRSKARETGGFPAMVPEGKCINLDSMILILFQYDPYQSV